MKRVRFISRCAAFAAALTLGLSMVAGSAEAARIGGGRSFGMQRQMSTPISRPAAATPSRAPGAPAAQPQRSSWLGPIAGLAAGLGLAALANHLGFGEELGNLMMLALLAFAALAVIRFVMRRMAGGGQRPAMAGNAPNGTAYNSNYSANTQDVQYQAAHATGGASNAGAGVGTGNIPAGFDTDAFLRNAKVGFIRLQAANDAGDLADIREFTSPEMFAEIRLDLEQRNGIPQKTDIVSLNADLLDVAEEGQRYVVSVRFSGLLREEANAAPVNIDEIWHLSKPINGQGGWVLAGIQQMQ